MRKNPSEVIKTMFRSGHNYVLCYVTKTVNGNIVRSKDIIHNSIRDKCLAKINSG